MRDRFDRREIIGMAGSAALLALAPPVRAAGAPSPPWNELAGALGPRFRPVSSPLEACARAGGQGADALFATLKNPYAIGDDPALTQTLGWTDAWVSRASSHVVAAESAADIAAAVNFARRHRVRLVTKGGGHSYFGNSNAADSLLVWTRAMDAIDQHDAFVPTGAPAGTAPVTAVSVGTGALWGRVYQDTAVRHGRYVQGGGCLTVGVASFVLGGGFGSFSKGFGTGAANLLEAEIVTADGAIRTVNPWREPDLFMALRGGGGGTFGIATRLTLRTFPLPETICAVILSVQARDDAAWRALVERMMALYAGTLFNPHWGEQIRFSPGRRLSVMMTAQGLDKAAIEAAWNPFLAWVRGAGDAYRLDGEPLVLTVPGRRFWDPAALKAMPGVVLTDNRPGASPDNVFWASNLGEAGQTLHAYKSRWLPAALLADAARPRLVDTIIEGAAHWSVALHTNKGMAGGDAAALARVRETATNPQVLDAFALLIVAADGPPAWPGIPGHEPDTADGRKQAAGVARAFAPFETLTPGAGCYMSEADYFGDDWQQAYWGGHHARLADIKRRYDPTGLFTGHHCITAGA